METAKQEIKQDARTYFLNQGQAIGKLHGILYTHSFTKHLGKWLSLFLEIVFYLVFLGILCALIIMPTDPYVIFNINHDTELEINLHIEDLSTLILIFKITIAALSLPVLAFAILLGRIRRRNTIISKAFDETVKMKTEFDKAVLELNF